MKDFGLILLSRTLSLKLTKACLKHKMLCIFLCRDERPILVIRLLKVKTFIVSWMQFSMFPILWDFYDYIALQFHTKTLFLISFSTAKPQENSNCRITADFEAEDRCHVLYFFTKHSTLEADPLRNSFGSSENSWTFHCNPEPRWVKNGSSIQGAFKEWLKHVLLFN